jgi:hypothetical protein
MRMSNYIITAEDGTFWVWEPGLDMPWADFPTKEEAEAYIHHCQKVDQLEQEFREWFDGKVAEYGISPGEARDAIRLALPTTS